MRNLALLLMVVVSKCIGRSAALHNLDENTPEGQYFYAEFE